MKKQKQIKNIFYIFNLILAVLSLYNIIVGLGEETLFSTFSIAAPHDLIAFFIISVIFSLVGIFFVMLINKIRADKYIEYATAYLFITLLFEYIILGKIENSKVFITFIICAFAAVIPYILEKKGIIKTSTEIEWKDWKITIPYFTAWFIIVSIRIPIELYINNLGDFQFMFWHYMAVLLLCSIILIGALYVLSVILLNKRQTLIVTTVMFAFTVMGYVQEMVLNRSLDVLNGDQQVWNKDEIIVNLLIWLIGIVLICVLRIKVPKIENIYTLICVYVCLIQFVTSAYLIIVEDTNNDAAFKTFTNEGALELNKNNNVILFIVDRCDTSHIYEILENEPEFLEQLSDFTFYPNNTCEFANTLNAIPYILTGTKLNGTRIAEYPRYAYENSDFLQVVHENGYNIALYTDEDYVEEPYREHVLNYDADVKQKCRIVDTFNQLMTCSKYRIAPIIMKNVYKYNGRDIDNLIDESYTWTINNDYPFYSSLMDNGLSISDEDEGKGTFYLYHFWGAHSPTNWSTNMKPVKLDSVSETEQTKAVFKMLYEYIGQMKKLDKYDDATIIITADHGKQLSSDYYLEHGVVDRTTIPILFVKYANQSNTEMLINESPVSQEELIPTILSAMGVEYTKFGRTFNEIGQNEERKRLYESGAGPIFEIQGDARQKENWKIVDYAKYE